MKTKKKRKAKPVEKEKPAYSISIKLGDQVLQGHGANALEALASIPRPVKIVTKGLLTIVNGTRRAEKMYMPVDCRRLFYPSAQYVVAKKLEFLLK